MAHTATYAVEVGDRGRLVLPAQVRRDLGLTQGGRLLLHVQEDGSLRLVSARAQAKRMQGLLGDITPGRSLAAELVAERRTEAAHENARP